MIVCPLLFGLWILATTEWETLCSNQYPLMSHYTVSVHHSLDSDVHKQFVNNVLICWLPPLLSGWLCMKRKGQKVDWTHYFEYTLLYITSILLRSCSTTIRLLEAIHILPLIHSLYTPDVYLCMHGKWTYLYMQCIILLSEQINYDC